MRMLLNLHRLQVCSLSKAWRFRLVVTPQSFACRSASYSCMSILIFTRRTSEEVRRDSNIAEEHQYIYQSLSFGTSHSENTPRNLYATEQTYASTSTPAQSNSYTPTPTSLPPHAPSHNPTTAIPPPPTPSLVDLKRHLRIQLQDLAPILLDLAPHPLPPKPIYPARLPAQQSLTIHTTTTAKLLRSTAVPSVAALQPPQREIVVGAPWWWPGTRLRCGWVLGRRGPSDAVEGLFHRRSRSLVMSSRERRLGEVC